MDVTVAAWAALIAGLFILILLDLLVVHRGAHEISMRDAAWSTAGFIAISVAFGVLLLIGAKFLLTDVVHIGVGVSLLVIVGVMGAAIATSLLRPQTSRH